MKVFVAKQPVYNIQEEIVGYELFYRNDLTNIFPEINRDQATAEVIINTHLNIGIQRLTKGKPFVIQFTEKLMKKRLPTFFSPQEMNVKIAHDVSMNRTLVKLVRELKLLGYTIILNAVSINKESPLLYELLTFIDILEVDFSIQASNWHKEMEELAVKHGLQLMAEKIETVQQYENAKARGYLLFQGYFFSEPIIQSAIEIPTMFSSNPLHQPNVNQLKEDDLVDIFERDLSSSIKLLRLINKNELQEHKVCCIREAISLIGAEEIQKWFLLLASRTTLNKQTLLSKEVNFLTLTRAKLCENIGKQLGVDDPSCLYLMGLISSIEKIKSESMAEILEGLPINEDLYQALSGEDNEYKLILDLVQAVERADFKVISDKCKVLNISVREVFRLYAESSNWSKKIVGTCESKDQRNGLLLP
jgi:c-di-GMP-related signal transduction protein